MRPSSGTYIRGFHREMMTGPMSLLLRSGTLRTEDVHEGREVLEVEIAGIASGRASAKDMEAMEESIDALKAPQISALEFAEADVAFHRRLAEAAGNRLFSVLANALNDVMIEVGLLAYEHNESSVERALPYHSWILENVRKRGVEGARRAMEEHLRSSLAQMRLFAAQQRLPTAIPANADVAGLPERHSYDRGNPSMQFTVIGAGNMGCIDGGNLARIGEQVALLDVWEDHVRRIQNKGLEIDGLHGTFVAPVTAISDAAAAPKSDIVLICANTYSPRDGANAARFALKDSGFVLTLQNGPGNVEILTEAPGKDRVMAGLSFHSADLRGPGEITPANRGRT